MGWTRIFRRRRGVGAGGYRPGAWGVVALPPVIAAAPPTTVDVGDAAPKVGLGFADGSTIEIERSTPASDALLLTASRLLGDGPTSAEPA